MPSLSFRTTKRQLRGLLRRFADPEYRRRQQFLRMRLSNAQTQLGAFIGQGAEFETGDKAFAMLSVTRVPMKATFNSLLAKAMQLAGYTPVIITDGANKEVDPFYRLFGFEHCVGWKHYQQDTVTEEHVRALASDLMPAVLTYSSINACFFEQVAVGKYAFSSACRDAKLVPVDLNEPAFRQAFFKKLYLAIGSVLAARRLFSDYPIRKIMVTDIGYVPNGPILDVALQQKIDALVMALGQRRDTWVFKRYKTPGVVKKHEFSLDGQTWTAIQKLPWTAEMDREVTREFGARYATESDHDTRRLQYGKRQSPPDDVRQKLGLDPAKKTAVIFAHVSWDGAFFFGEDLFDSFDDWLVQTAQGALANPKLNWIIKLHPLNILKQQVEERGQLVESELAHLAQLGPLPAHVKIVHSDTDISTLSLYAAIDYGITVRGTVGLELPCLGIPVLTAGTGRYDGFGFTYDSESRESYFAKLAGLHLLPPLPKEAIELARKHYYYLILRRQVSFADIVSTTIRQRNEADTQLFNSLEIKANSLEQIRQSPSIQAFVQWAVASAEADFMQPIDES